MRVPGDRGIAKLKERSAVGSPRHLKYPRLALVAFDAETWMEAPVRPEIVNQLPDSRKEQPPLRFTEPFPVAPEAWISVLCWH